MAKVNVIYHHFPHYRRPVMHALVKSGVHEYQFWGAMDTVEGIKVFTGDDLIQIQPLRFHMRGQFWIVKGFWPAVFDRDASVLMVHGNPNMPASWMIGAVGRLLGKKVVFWVHGWLKAEPPLKALVRNLHYRLGHAVMTYAERAKVLAAESGFPAERVVPIYNSLDWPTAKKVFEKLQVTGIEAVREELGISSTNFNIVCVARLTTKCRFDVLFEAMAIMRNNGSPCSAILIGDGEERTALEAQAKALGLDVTFLGAVYNEEVVGKYIYAGDATVSPGKVGLTAMHSLMYGTPVFTHGAFDHQMPEVEAITPAVTGDFFTRDDPTDLARVLTKWIGTKRGRADVQASCIQMIEDKYNPEVQAEIINSVVTKVVAL